MLPLDPYAVLWLHEQRLEQLQRRRPGLSARRLPEPPPSPARRVTEVATPPPPGRRRPCIDEGCSGRHDPAHPEAA